MSKLLCNVLKFPGGKMPQMTPLVTRLVEGLLHFDWGPSPFAHTGSYLCFIIQFGVLSIG